MTLDEIKETSRLLMRANEANPDPNTSQAVATSIMLALLAGTRTGRGQAIEVTMLRGNAWANADEAYDYPGRPLTVLSDEECYGLHALYRLYPASEGWVFLACPFYREWRKFCLAVSRPELAAESRFSSSIARAEHDKNSPAKSAKSSLCGRLANGSSSSRTRESRVCAPTATSAAF